MIRKVFVFVLGLFLLSVTASYTRAASVDMGWDAPIDGGEVVGYLVYWSITSGSYDDVDSIEIVGKTSATVTELDESRTHYFIVRAYNSAGIGPASNEITIETYSDSFYDDSPSDSESSDGDGGGGGCFIATAAYGSPFEAHVSILREFRDKLLLGTPPGKAFVNFYYQYSPPIARIISEHESLRLAVRWVLLPLIGFSWAILNLGLINTLIMIFIFSSGLITIIGSGRKINAGL